MRNVGPFVVFLRERNLFWKLEIIWENVVLKITLVNIRHTLYYIYIRQLLLKDFLSTKKPTYVFSTKSYGKFGLDP